TDRCRSCLRHPFGDGFVVSHLLGKPHSVNFLPNVIQKSLCVVAEFSLSRMHDFSQLDETSVVFKLLLGVTIPLYKWINYGLFQLLVALLNCAEDQVLEHILWVVIAAVLQVA
ncbi:hypothetical protein ACHAWX_005236, partial [Stephanocyclus meneghinianus]